jgi:hypothetical protein
VRSSFVTLSGGVVSGGGVSGGGAPAPSAFLDRRGDDRGRPLLSDLVRLGIQILDRDPGQRAHRQSEGDDVVGPLAVDMDLDRT